jgi:hypothetical protein
MKIIKSIGSNIKKISEYLLKNKFILVKNFRHPMMHYQDSLYINKKYYDK